MDDRQLRELLGTIAGALVGLQSARGGMARKASGVFAGGVGGLFASDLVNALKDVAKARDGTIPHLDDISEKLNAVEAQAFIRGCLLGGLLMSAIERIMNAATASPTIDAFLKEHWNNIETECRSEAKNAFSKIQKVWSSGGLPPAHIAFDPEGDIDLISQAVKAKYDI